MQSNNAMFKFGITTLEQLLNFDERRSRIIRANLLLHLDDLDSETASMLRDRIVRKLVLPNTTGKTTWASRFASIDKDAAEILKDRFPDSLFCLDIGVSDGTTGVELFEHLQGISQLTYVLTDINEYIYIREGHIWTDVCDDEGKLIQASIGPFVIPITTLIHMHPLQLVNRALYLYNRVFRTKKVMQRCLSAIRNPKESGFKKVSLLHPKVRSLISRDPRISFRRLDVFSPPPLHCDFLRMMNVLNLKFDRSGFTKEQVVRGLRSTIPLLNDGGCLLLGRTSRTSEDKLVTNATLFEKKDRRLHCIRRFGSGSELEKIVDSITF